MNKCHVKTFLNMGKSWMRSMWLYIFRCRHFKTHSGENSNKCNQCDFASIQAVSLRKHLKTHSGEKSNKCNQYDIQKNSIVISSHNESFHVFWYRNDCGQWEHTNGFSPVCLLLWTFRFESEPETSSHWSQGYGFSVCWCIWCCLRYSLFVNDLLHLSQLNNMLFVWRRSWCPWLQIIFHIPCQ